MTDVVPEKPRPGIVEHLSAFRVKIFEGGKAVEGFVAV